MANEAHLEILRQGVDAWNRWRAGNPGLSPDLSGTDLQGEDLSEANLNHTDLSRADLRLAVLRKADMGGAGLRQANLSAAMLRYAALDHANLSLADLHGADFRFATLYNAELLGADLRRADLYGADLRDAKLREAQLCEAALDETRFSRADLSRADLSGADLTAASLVEATLDKATLRGARVYGTAAWNLRGTPADQRNLVVTGRNEPAVTVDDLAVAQFVYLLLSNPNLRRVLDIVGEKGVLILGRFGDRKPILDRLRTRVRELGFAPMVFDFEKPVSKDFTETVRTLAGMSAFIVADITKPRAVPQEAQAIIPDYMVPFVPIIEAGEEPWSMFKDLWIKHRDWVFEPLRYPSIDELIPKLGSAVVAPALERRKVLLARRAEEMGTRSLSEFENDEE